MFLFLKKMQLVLVKVSIYMNVVFVVKQKLIIQVH